ncbi:MAG: adenylyltransferase/cytidyltransferase family protein [Moorea sp. SIO1F2]|uniref:Adenylyltransferase/cytidyltransferase family protein n=1 Tax=Moorena producens (strain JHB) TaxID=1454205 RepID=A0A1D9G6Y5_MOOP1|nr:MULTISPECIES: adenylyltransferase/cytidyltransferase family protein [Moorena]NEN97743.1 adenylyltransferase/cytidyltransferase family protein [Moorena sp. SIO3I7]NEO65910.1 adenylyltransferase/cytidyltransferase family protein [Moorena sp. SIO4G2]NEO92885.1 adenylyltransferase/cytidyltransferase family protein [Moorena sp. SIO3G5]AOY83235.1 adenylyltransferase/cytidyltransferase family protein [Moorena producens JHB]NEO09670.1 adenylyltransferase/cytidyltransferase family protein [Moorena s
MTGIYTADELQQLITHESERWRPLVFTNGCFDLLHIGHVRYLKIAKSLGSSLVVGLNSDQSVNRIKPSQPGYPPRPLVPEIQRAEILATLKPVDGVVIFAETTATRLIEALQPEVYVKGGDYSLSTLPEAPIVQSYGGRIELVQVEFPTSTTQIINRILQAR